MEMSTMIDAAIWAAFPHYRRIVVTGTVRQTAALEAHAAIKQLVRSLQLGYARAAEPLDHPGLTAWRSAFKSIGINPGKFRPANEALVRRAARGEDLVLGHPLVDLGTAVTLATQAPVGMHMVNDLSAGLELRPATGQEVSSLSPATWSHQRLARSSLSAARWHSREGGSGVRAWPAA